VDSEIEIIHLGYNIPSEELKKKAERNLTILKQEYDKNNSAYNAFQLANTYCVLKEYDSANKYYTLSVKNEELKNVYKAHAYLNLSDYEIKRQNLNSALEYLNKGLLNDPSNPQLNLLASDIFYRLKKEKKSIEFCKTAFRTNNKILSGLNKSNLSVGVRPEEILSKGIYYSFLYGDADNLKYFSGELRRENDKLFFIFKKLIENQTFSGADKGNFIKLVSLDNIDTILILTENYRDKKQALELMLSIKKRFENNSKYLKTLGLLYSEINMLEESADVFECSLKLKEKDPAAVFYLISVLVRIDKTDKIPGVLLFAEKEFGDIPEFKKNFELLKEKLSSIINN
jgi:tetratricopeptide (TPR) repeat protein